MKFVYGHGFALPEQHTVLHGRKGRIAKAYQPGGLKAPARQCPCHGPHPALHILQELGAYCIDCDAVYHEQLRSDAALRGAITDAFGDVFGADGLLDRQKLENIVFSDPAALEKLNTIIYTHLPRALRQRADASGADVVALDAINLIESGLGALCRRTVAVLAPADVRAASIMARDGIPEEYARLRIAAQKNDDFYRAHCTDVLWTDAPSS